MKGREHRAERERISCSSSLREGRPRSSNFFPPSPSCDAMDAVKSLVIFCFCGGLPAEASSWDVGVPTRIEALPGSCVVIPCWFSYPAPAKPLSEITGIWMDSKQRIIYHTDASKVIFEYRGRTELLGDVWRGNCSLKVYPLKAEDQGPFFFRVEMKNYEKFSYANKMVHIQMTETLEPSDFKLRPEGETTTASCSVVHSCRPYPPEFVWSYPGQQRLQEEELDGGRWRSTSHLTFGSDRAVGGFPLTCSVIGGGWKRVSNVTRELEYAPENVKVVQRSWQVMEGQNATLTCTGDGNPAVREYEWRDDGGALLHEGETFLCRNITRHTGALYCSASNKVGRRKSNPVHFDVLYAPEIKKSSSCSRRERGVECVCIVESNPPGNVHFLLSDSVLPGATVSGFGSVTIASVKADFGSSGFVSCVANNSVGTADAALTLPANGNETMQYVYYGIAIGVGGILVNALILVLKPCRTRAPAMSATQIMEVNFQQSTRPYRKDICGMQDSHGAHDKYGHIYQFDGVAEDEAIYANLSR